MIKGDSEALDVLSAAHEEVNMHLLKFSSEDVSINEVSNSESPILTYLLLNLAQTAREMGTAIWSQEIAIALTKYEGSVEAGQEWEPRAKLAHRLRMMLREVWKKPSNDVFTAE